MPAIVRVKTMNKRIGEVCSCAGKNSRLVIALPYHGKEFGIGRVKFSGMFYNAVEIIHSHVLRADVILIFSLVKFPLHRTKNIAHINDGGVAFQC